MLGRRSGKIGSESTRLRFGEVNEGPALSKRFPRKSIIGALLKGLTESMFKVEGRVVRLLPPAKLGLKSHALLFFLDFKFHSVAMLNVWKKRWKDEGTSENCGRGTPIGGSVLTASELEGTETALPNGDSLSDSSSIFIPSKRHGGENQLGSSRKRRKTLPENERIWNFANSLAGHEVLELALKENSQSLSFCGKPTN